MKKNKDKLSEVPSRWQVNELLDAIIVSLYPSLQEKRQAPDTDLAQMAEDLLSSYANEVDKQATVDLLIDQLPHLKSILDEDAQVMYDKDPAAKSLAEVIVCYPGFWAIIAYRIAHIWEAYGVPVVPRMMTEYAHTRTGIDIHPGAKIGRAFSIDHGTGVVVGETAVIGNHVQLYQGVTLGAISVSKVPTQEQRHPTIEDHVVIYANATILGGNTVVGHHSVVGGNVWLSQSIEPYTMVLSKSEITVMDKNPNKHTHINYII